jgi:hypothetical protein
VTGRKLCRAHGGKAGAPKGNQNALKSGLYTNEAFARDQRARVIMRKAAALFGQIDPLILAIAASGADVSAVKSSAQSEKFD